MTIYTGEQFNQKFKDIKFVKLIYEIRDDRYSSNFCDLGYRTDIKYMTGINRDNKDFNPSGQYQPGGLYFYELSKLSLFLGGKVWPSYIRYVTIPNEAQIYEEVNIFKADQIILSKEQKLANLEIWENEKWCLQAILQNPKCFYYIKTKTNDICLAAVERIGNYISSISEQTEEMCLAAVKSNGLALKYVKIQNHDICLTAVKSNGLALEYVKIQNYDICLTAVKSNGLALQYVEIQTHDICLQACKQDGLALEYVKVCDPQIYYQTPEICVEAIKSNGLAIKYVNIDLSFIFFIF